MRGLLVLTVMGFCMLPATLLADGNPPLPVMKGVVAQSDAQYDKATGSYTYSYIAHNGADSAGNVGSLFLDHTMPSGVTVPAGWIWEQRKDGSLMLSYGAMGPGKQLGSILTPGGEMRFSLTSRSPPVIKTLRLRADWIPEGEGDEDDATRALYAQLDTPVHVLAPGTEALGSYEHWSRFRDDLASANLLGWMPDAAFAQTVSTELAAARRAFETQGPHAAEAPLKALMTTMAGSTPAQRNAEAYALVTLNAAALLATMQAAPATAAAPERGAQFQMRLDDSQDKTVALGVPAVFSGRLTDRADDDRPVAGFPIDLFVGTGPDMNARVKGKTDADGRFTLSLDGKAHGTDYVVLGNKPYGATVRVTWEGGPDLVVGGFVVPLIQWRGFGPIYFHDTVANTGDGPAGPSTLRYYGSPTQPVDPKTARVVSVRHVPALNPDEVSEAPKDPGTFPTDLPPGRYYLMACVTEDSGPPESNLSNNCQDGSGSGMHMMIAAPVMTTHAPPR